MKTLLWFFNIVDWLNETIGNIFGYLILTLTFLIFADIFLRYVFGWPIIWGMEVNQYQLITLVFISGGYAYLHNGHVRVDVLYERLSNRAKAFLNLITSFFVFLVCIILIIYGYDVALEAFVNDHRATTVIASPLWPSYLMIPLGALLLGLQSLVNWLRDLIFVVTGEPILSKYMSGEGGIFVRDGE